MHMPASATPSQKCFGSSAFPLFHLSEECHNGEVLVPRPLRKLRVMDGEDWRSKRICVSSSIDGAVSALADSMSMPWGLLLYVHKVANAEELFNAGLVYKPSLAQVPDSEANCEYWLKGKAVLKCIGRIKVGFPTGEKVPFMWLGDECTVDRFEWEWVSMWV